MAGIRSAAEELGIELPAPKGNHQAFQHLVKISQVGIDLGELFAKMQALIEEGYHLKLLNDETWNTAAGALAAALFAHKALLEAFDAYATDIALKLMTDEYPGPAEPVVADER